jgi:hypothetical protein
MKLTIYSIITCILIAHGREVGRVAWSPLILGDFILPDSNSSGDLEIIVGVLEKVTIIHAPPTTRQTQLPLQM